MNSKKRFMTVACSCFSMALFVGAFVQFYTPAISDTNNIIGTKTPLLQMLASVTNASQIGTTSVTIDNGANPGFSWTMATNATLYDVYISFKNTPNTAIVRAEARSQQYILANNNFADGQYSIWVRGKNGSALGVWSAPVHFTIVNATLSIDIGTVTGLTPTGTISSNTPVFTWNSAANAKVYDVYVSKKDTPNTEILRTEVTTLSHTFANYSFANGEYSFWVRGKNGSALGIWSAPVHFTVDHSSTNSSVSSVSTLPITDVGTVTAFNVILSIPNQPIITWKAARNATTYEVLVRKNGIGNPIIFNNNTTALSWNFSRVLENGVYNFWVRGKNGATVGTWSEAVNFTVTGSVNSNITSPTVAPSSRVGAIANVNIVTTITDRPIFSWNAAANATTYETLLQKNGVASTLLGNFINSQSTQSPTPLASGNYTFWVRGKNGSALGAWSQPVNFTIIEHAATSVIGTATTITTLSVGNIITTRTPKLEWNPVTNATAYDILLRKNGTTSSTVSFYDIKDLFKQITMPLESGDYTFWMRGKNSTAIGNWSGPTNFTVSNSAVVTVTTPVSSVSSTVSTNTSVLPVCEQTKSKYVVVRHDEQIAKEIFDAFNQRIPANTPDRLAVFDKNWVTYYQNTPMKLLLACKDNYGNEWEEYRVPLLNFYVSGWRNTTKNEPVPTLLGVVEKLNVYRQQVAGTTTNNNSSSQTTLQRPGLTEAALAEQERARYNNLIYFGDKKEVIRQCLGTQTAMMQIVNATEPVRVNNQTWPWVFYPLAGNKDYALYYRGHLSKVAAIQEFKSKYASVLNAATIKDCQNKNSNLTSTSESDYNDCLAKNREQYASTYNACATNNPTVCQPQWLTCVSKGDCKASAKRTLDLGINYCENQRDKKQTNTGPGYDNTDYCREEKNRVLIPGGCYYTDDSSGNSNSGNGGNGNNQCNGSDTVADPTKTIRLCLQINGAYFLDTTYYTRNGCLIPPTIRTSHGTDWRCGQ